MCVIWDPDFCLSFLFVWGVVRKGQPSQISSGGLWGHLFLQLGKRNSFLLFGDRSLNFNSLGETLRIFRWTRSGARQQASCVGGDLEPMFEQPHTRFPFAKGWILRLLQ